MKFILTFVITCLFSIKPLYAATPLTELACEKEGEIKALWEQFNCKENHDSTSCKQVKKLRARANFELGISVRTACAKGRFSRDKSVRDKANKAHESGANKIAIN